MRRVRRLNDALWRFTAGAPDVHATALVSEDGFLLGRALSATLDERHAVGLTHAMLDLAERASAELGRGRHEVLMPSPDGYAAALPAGSGTVLLSLAQGSADPGALLPRMRSAATDLRQILESQR
ncbi:MAG: roadblock/LC7 domain-containing protein [Myxococcales bacterium]|nr:roadblock/LC7 domain-containing protein [Myxococcales bacterium]